MTMGLVTRGLLGGGVSSDGTAPTITSMSPTPGTELGRLDVITFHVGDVTPGLRMVVVTIKYELDPETYVVHNGTEFLYPFDSSESGRTATGDGYDFAILPRGGWIYGDIEQLFVYAVDQAGNLEGSLP